MCAEPVPMMRYQSSDYSTLSGKKSFSDVIKVPNQNMKVTLGGSNLIR